MWCFWSAKGGVGCTVAAMAVAVRSAGDEPTLLVDLGGDALMMVGGDEAGHGLADWLQAPAPPPDALARLEVDVGHGLGVLPWEGRAGSVATEQPPGPGPASPGRNAGPTEALARAIAVEHRPVVVDIGLRTGDRSPRAALAEQLLLLASRSTLVTRPCVLAAAAAERHNPPDDVIVVGHGGHRRRRGGHRPSLPQPSVPGPTVHLRWDPAVAASVNGGDLARRQPRSLRALAERLSS